MICKDLEYRSAQTCIVRLKDILLSEAWKSHSPRVLAMTAIRLHLLKCLLLCSIKSCALRTTCRLANDSRILTILLNIYSVMLEDVW